MKKKTNLTSILGLAIELASLLISATLLLTGKEIPQAVSYLFLCGLLITIAGAGKSIHNNKK